MIASLDTQFPLQKTIYNTCMCEKKLQQQSLFTMSVRLASIRNGFDVIMKAYLLGSATFSSFQASNITSMLFSTSYLIVWKLCNRISTFFPASKKFAFEKQNYLF